MKFLTVFGYRNPENIITYCVFCWMRSFKWIKTYLLQRTNSMHHFKAALSSNIKPKAQANLCYGCSYLSCIATHVTTPSVKSCNHCLNQSLRANMFLGTTEYNLTLLKSSCLILILSSNELIIIRHIWIGLDWLSLIPNKQE